MCGYDELGFGQGLVKIEGEEKGWDGFGWVFGLLGEARMEKEVGEGGI